jgi:hypothetical protein
MASGHVNRTKRPNTWLHRPDLRREDSPCQLGAVHTWPIATLPQELMPANAPKALKQSDAGAVRPSAFKALVEIRSY